MITNNKKSEKISNLKKKMNSEREREIKRKNKKEKEKEISASEWRFPR